MGFLTLFVLFYWALGQWYFGSKRPQYSHVKFSISELAETGSRFERQVSFGLFLPLGLSAIAVAVFSVTEHPVFAWLIGAFGVSYFLSAFFPCDPGTPLIGSWRNGIHNLIGGGCYATMAYQLNELAAQPHNFPSQIALFLLCGFLLAFVLGWPKSLIGFLQRLAEFSILVLVAVSLW